MTRSRLNSNVHARVQNRLRHRGLTGLARGEWNLVREEIDLGGSPKAIAKRATARVISAREAEALDMLSALAVAHEPIDDATRIFAGV